MKNTLKKIIPAIAAGIFCILFIVSCKKENDDNVTDIDGNVYKIISIGGNVWMAENLRTTKFRDGTAISLVTGEADWAALSSPAYCWPENNASYKSTLGGFYNGYAVLSNKGLCPSGWHVATDGDWMDMEQALGMSQSAAASQGTRGVSENVGGKLKSTSYWDAPNTGADNTSGFSAYGTGYRRPPGEFAWFRQWTGYYTSTGIDAQHLWMRYIGFDMQGIDRNNYPLQYAYSIRCVED